VCSVVSCLFILIGAMPGWAQQQVDFATYLGGSQYDRAQGVAVDRHGQIYVVLNTFSTNLPTTAGVCDRTHNGGQDAYVAKLAGDGRSLVWGTYLGGSAEDRGYGVRIGTDGSVYVIGITKSSNFPTTAGAFQRTLGGDADIFVTRLTGDGTTLIYSTYLGGSAEDWCRGNVFVDPQGAIYLGGHTKSANYPTTPGAYQRVHANPGGWDAILTKVAPDGGRLVFSTLYGGRGYDATYTGVVVHADGTICVAGMTNSADLPVTAGAFQGTYGGGTGTDPYVMGDGLVARFSADGSQLLFSTYLGGSGNDACSGNDGLVLDVRGNAIVTGITSSVNFPTTAGAFDRTYAGGIDGFVAKLSPDGRSLLASTYIGGSAAEETSGIDIDPNGRIYLSGTTASRDYPVTPDALQASFGGGEADVMVSVLTPDLSSLLWSTYYGGGGVGGYAERGRCLTLDNRGRIVVSGDTNSSDFPCTPGVLQTSLAGDSDAFVLRLVPALVPIQGDADGKPDWDLDVVAGPGVHRDADGQPPLPGHDPAGRAAASRADRHPLGSRHPRHVAGGRCPQPGDFRPESEHVKGRESGITDRRTVLTSPWPGGESWRQNRLNDLLCASEDTDHAAFSVMFVPREDQPKPRSAQQTRHERIRFAFGAATAPLRPAS